jgi:hypothetical protein
MASTIIHVNRHTIASNRRRGENKPPLAVRRGRSGRAIYTHKVEIYDTYGDVVATVVSSPNKPLKCGATVYIEIPSAVVKFQVEDDDGKSKDNTESDHSNLPG